MRPYFIEEKNIKPYFIGQGTGIVQHFDTLEEMLDYHSRMDDLDRHFCKLYDRKNNRIASGNDIIFNRGWRIWNDSIALAPLPCEYMLQYFEDDLEIDIYHHVFRRVYESMSKAGFVFGEKGATHTCYREIQEIVTFMDKMREHLYAAGEKDKEDATAIMKKMFRIFGEQKIALFELKNEYETYRHKAIKLLQTSLSLSKDESEKMLDVLIEKGNYKPNIFPVLKAPVDVANWNTVILED